MNPEIYNPEQRDVDRDSVGDECDGKEANFDTDGDLIEDSIDNCPEVYNADQVDRNGNDIGDACELVSARDSDGDSVVDDLDNCPSVPNAGDAQNEDEDGDGIGDACDPDFAEAEPDEPAG